MELVGAVATFVAVFALLMAVFGPALLPPQRVEAVRAAALPRHRFERLVSAERPWWERLVAPLAGRIALRLPALAHQVDESLIVRAGLDPAVLTPGEVYAAKLVAALAVLAVGAALTPLLGAALLLALLPAFGAYVFPTEYLGWRARRRRAQLVRELPDFLAVLRPMAERKPIEEALSGVTTALDEAAEGRNLLARQLLSAVAAYGTNVSLFDALHDVAAANDLEPLDELAMALGQVRSVGAGIPQAIEAAERGLREDERNRLLGAASTVQPKLAAILAGIYLPEFLLLILVPMFISTLGRL
jgi:hypothetical protein